MSKKDKFDVKKSPLYLPEVYNKNIEEVNISDTCKEYMQIFGANVNILRHTPFLIDGLKPGARRLLYTMWEIYKARHDGKFRKVDMIVSQTMALHPHGSTPTYQVLVKLAQPWNNLVCPIEGSGNIGSVTGATAAAGRYLEARLSYFAYKCFFEDFDKSVCNMQLNYNGEIEEPEFLPAKYPNVIINNSFGIGYGVMSAIPTFNFKEVCELTIKLIKNPDLKDVYLIPDIPTGCHVVDEGQFPRICKEGKGKFKMRGEVVVDDHTITILSTPTKTNSDLIKQDILKLFKEGKIQGLVNFEDKSGEVNNELKIIFRKGLDMKAIEHLLYKVTGLQKSEHISFSVVDDYRFETMNLKTILTEWIDYRRELKRKIYNKKYVKGNERLHLLEIMILILSEDNLERTSTITRKSKNKKEMVERLMDTYGISSLQADYIASMKFSAFTIDAREKYKEERDSLVKDIEIWKGIMFSKDMVDEIIIEELKEGIKLFGEPRRSKVITIEGEATISLSDHTVVVTKEGYIKKLPHDTTEVGAVNQGDYPIEITHINNGSDLLLFDTMGTVFRLPVSSIRSTPLDSVGDKITDYVQISGEVRAIMPKPTKEELDKAKKMTGLDAYFVMVTKNGIIKKTLVERFANISTQLVGMLVKDGDSLKSVITVLGDKDVVVYTDCGVGVRINTDTIKETSRTSIGVKALDLQNDEIVVGASLVNEQDRLLFMLTNKGNGKKCSLATFATMDRNSKPLKLIGLAEGEKLQILESVVGDETFKVFLKGQVETVNIQEVQELTRISKGTKLVPVRRGEVIIDIREVK